MSEETMIENWAPVPNCNYEVSDLGRIRHKKTKHIKGTHPNCRTGYVQVQLWCEGKYRTCYVHHLVAAAWLSPASINKTQLDHKDENKMNNAVSNLEWVTQPTNIQRSFAAGGRKKVTGPRLSEAQIAAIKSLAAQGISQVQIGIRLGICNSTVSKLLKRVREAAVAAGI